MASSPSSRLLLPLVTDPCLICLNGTRKDDDVYDTYEINGFHCSDAITAVVKIESGSESCSFFTEAFGPSCCDHPSTTDTMLSPTLADKFSTDVGIGQVFQIAVIMFTIVCMILIFYCLCAGKRLCSDSKDNSNPITQAAVDLIRDPIPNTVIRSDDATVNSDAASENVVVKVTRIRIPVEINIGPSTRRRSWDTQAGVSSIVMNVPHSQV